MLTLGGALVGVCGFGGSLLGAAVVGVSANGAGEMADAGVDFGDGLLAISDDGDRVFFASGSANLVAGDGNGESDLFVKILSTGELRRLSTSLAGAETNAGVTGFRATRDGRHVVFGSFATNLMPAGLNPSGFHENLYRKDVDTGVVWRVTTDATGKGEGENIDGSAAGSRNFRFRGSRPQVSDDGNHVSFWSETSTFLGIDPLTGFVYDLNRSRDVYVKDPVAGTVHWASTDGNGQQVCENGPEGCGKVISAGVISGDGRYVVFGSTQNNLVAGDTNGVSDLFRKDLQTGAVVRVNTKATGAQDAEWAQDAFWVSRDGRYVGFGSSSTTLVEGGEGTALFFKDLADGSIDRVPGGTFTFNHSAGDYVVFSTFAALVAEDTNELADIYRYHVPTGELRWVSSDADGSPVTGPNWGLHDKSSVSSDGRYVAFRSSSEDLVAGDTNGQIDIFVKDLETGEVVLVSKPAGGQGDAECDIPVISGDGSTVAFFSRSTNLLGGDPVTQRNYYAVRLRGGTGPERPDLSAATPGGTANQRLSTHAGDPVNTSSGELYERLAPDLDLGGPMPLQFRRSYGAFLRRNFVLGDLGSNWRHNFDARLFVVGNTAKYVSHAGRVTSFLRDGAAGLWRQQGNLDTPYQLVTEGGADAVLYDPVDGLIYTFDFTTGQAVMGKLVEVADGRGNVHTVSYHTERGEIASVVDGLGRSLTFHYNDDAIRKIRLVTDGTRTVTFEYTDPNDSELLTRVTDVMAGVTEYHYEDTGGTADHGLLSRWTLPRGNTPYRQVFDDEGRVVEQRDSDERLTVFAYGVPVANRTTLTDPLGVTRVHHYDGTGIFMGMDDEAGESFALGANATGQRTSITDRLGGVTGYSYHAASGRLAGVAHADGETRSILDGARAWTGLSLPQQEGIDYEDGTREQFSYDAQGNLVRSTDRVGEDTVFTHNGRGQVLTATNAASGVSRFIYHADGTLATATDPASNETRFAYDALRRLVRVTNADDSTVGFSYDAADRLLTRTDENGGRTTYTYDANGNLVTTEAPGAGAAKRTVLAYDGNDRVVSVTAPEGGVVRFEYHALGGVGSVTGANDGVVRFGYDARGRRTTRTAPLGQVWTFGYDSEAVVTSVRDPAGQTTRYETDARGRVTAVVSPLGHRSEVRRDALGRPTRLTDRLGRATVVERDANGLVARVVLPGGVTEVNYERDVLGNVTEVRDGDGSEWRTGYDAGGREVSRQDPLERERTTEYDARNRASRVTYPGGLGRLDLSYDAAGQLVRRVYSDGTEIHYRYTATGKLAAAGDGATDLLVNRFDAEDRNVECNGIGAAYDAGGRLVTLTLAPGKTVTYSYDANDRLVKVRDWAGGETDYAYDDVGRRTAIERPNGVDLAAAYDADSRVTRLEEGEVSDIQLTRDAEGQVTAAVRDVPQVDTTAGLASWERSFDAASQVAGSTYDAMGRLTADGADTYEWDLASRLTAYERGGEAVSASYDPAGFRLTRTAGGETRRFVWNYILDLPAPSVERDGGGADRYYYVHLPDGELQYRVHAVTGAREFYHYDEMGNVVFVTDDAGAVVASYAYTPYGELTGSAGALDNPFTWQGRWGAMDEGNGLYYIRARYYDSGQGRFISKDPLRGTGPRTVNPYAYALGNPVGFVDVDGRRPEGVGGGVTGTGIGLAETSGGETCAPGGFEVPENLESLEQYAPKYAFTGSELAITGGRGLGGQLQGVADEGGAFVDGLIERGALAGAIGRAADPIVRGGGYAGYRADFGEEGVLLSYLLAGPAFAGDASIDLLRKRRPITESLKRRRKLHNRILINAQQRRMLRNYVGALGKAAATACGDAAGADPVDSVVDDLQGIVVLC